MKLLYFAEVSYLDTSCKCYCFIWPYLDPNCLQSVSADDTSRQRVNQSSTLNLIIALHIN